MKSYFITTIIIILCLVGNAQEISNIHFEQEGKMIDIYYDLSGEGIYDIKVFCSQDGGDNWGSPLINVSGDIGKNQVAGFGKKVVWDVLIERDSVQGNIKFKIEASSGDLTNENEIFTDLRDGKAYKWVKIGEQIWMAENLNYITESGSWCYDNQTSNCNTYGRLYDWVTANAACPAGWRVPNDEDWNTLIKYLGGKREAGGKLKEAGMSHWQYPNTGATNASGFNAVSGGYPSYYGAFYGLGKFSHYWSSSESSSVRAWLYTLSYGDASLDRGESYKKFGYSVRCIKN